MHDVGGRLIVEGIDRDQHPFAPWEVRVDALMLVLTDASRAGGPLMTVDELRRGVEALSANDYLEMSYYQRWLRSLITIMIERGAIDGSELQLRVEALAAEHEREHEEGHHR